MNDPIADDCRKAADLLLGAFDWEGSPQGHEYWAAVYKALHKMADSEEAI